MKRYIPVMVLAIVTGLAANAWAVTLFSTQDTNMQSRADLADNTPGSLTFTFVGGDNIDDHNRTILRFDLTGQAGAAGNAILRLTISNPRAYDGRTAEVFVIKSSNAGWVEGDASWNNRIQSTTTAWDGGGGLGAPSSGAGTALVGDGFEGAGNLLPLDTLTFSGVSAGDKIDFTIPQSVVQDWINNTGGNAGLLLRDSYEGTLASSQHAFTFFTHDQDGTDSDPMLIFQIPEPSSLLLAGKGLAGLLCCLWRKRTRNA